MTLALSDRVQEINRRLLEAPPALSAERALLVTRFFKRHADPGEPVVLRKASALAWLLQRKAVRIRPRELLVGCFTEHVVGGNLYPELHGLGMLEDLFVFERRQPNPLRVARGDRRRLLLQVAPYWLPRFLAVRAFGPLRAVPFALSQLNATSHLVNETGGIAHFVPDYQGLVDRGTSGLRAEATARFAEVAPDSEEAAFLRAVDRALQGLEDFAAGYRAEAERQAAAEREPERRAELLRIADACGRVPTQPARTLHEGLQSILFAQIALNLESLDHAISPGRLDVILEPLYRADIEAGRLDRGAAYELLGLFALKLCEVVPVFSRRTTRFHGGMFNGQVVVVGGVDPTGEDVTGEVTWLLLELMDALRTRQPNYHARIHPGSPAPYRRRIAQALAAGAVSPAVYNDDAVIGAMRARGFPVAEARDYATVGCVEPVPAGQAFLSTDAALFNLPLCLELALNEGRRFGRRKRVGAATPPAEEMGSAEELAAAFEAQVRHGIGRLLGELRVIERANRDHHPTPLTSALVRGCVEKGLDASAGGARWNGSGIQGVGAPEVGDSLAAVEHVVFGQGRATMAEVVGACRSGFAGAEALRARLLRAPRYGNDDEAADRWTARVVEIYADALQGERNTRGGDYAPGFYSVTSHQAFGDVVGALPTGRRRGEPFSSGISPGNGAERRGPTASLSSAARLPLERAGNGVNFNLALAPWTVGGQGGPATLQALIDGGFAAGAMQVQVNVLDPAVLVEARDHPGRHPGLLVRVSGYSAYFDDLSPQIKQEIIDRTLFEGGGIV